MCKKLSVLASRVSNFRSVTRRPERPPSVIPTSRVLWLVAFAVVWTMTGYGGIAMGQVAGVDDPSDMADSSGDIKRIEAWMDEGNLHLTMTVYGVFAPSVEDTPAGMTNRYYYHWLLDTDNNPATGYLNDEYEGNATNLETPIGVDLVVMFGWRDGNTNGVEVYVALTEEILFEDYEYTIDGDTIHAVIPLEDLGLEPGQTIAVSAFQEGASNGWQCDWIESFELTLEDSSVSAYNPDPADGAYYTDTWATLSWSPDEAAVSHDVYFGEDFDSVNDGTGDTFRGNQPLTTTTFFVGFVGRPYPDGLVPGTTYYWRIDEVNDADPNSPWKGDVWNFMVPPRTAYDPNPADGAEFIDPNVELKWTAGYDARTHTVYFGDNFDDVNNDTGGDSIGAASYIPGPLESEKVYYWRVDEYDTIDTYKGEVWSFTTPGAVGSLNPSNGTTGVKMTATLSWTPGDSAASHEIYFGTDKDAVRNADTASPEYYKGTRNLGSESYAPPGKLAWYSTYYWRVDEVNNVNPDSPWKGNIWSFTTADFLVVDDIESYNNLDPNDPESNRIFKTWTDGWDVDDNGSVIGYPDVPFTEQGIVHGGSQSMPYSYDNNFKFSQAELPLSPPQDWTEEGVGVLSLWFRGDASNAAEQMYVAVSNAGGTPVVVPHDDPNAAQINTWTEWTIDLQAFADQGVDLTSVSTIAIGFGDKNNLQAGGSGKVYFDDIRLYRPGISDVSPITITIDNPGFEDPVLVEDDWTWGDVPGWTLVGGEVTDIEGTGIWHVTSADFDPVVAPDGQNVLYTEYLPEGIAKGVAQVLTDTFAANMDYTLTVEVGNSDYYYNAGYSVQLLAGGVVIAEDNDTLWPEDKTWATSTVAYTYDPADSALVGQPLEIRLLNLALDKDSPPAGEVVGVEFDNVKLSYEPAAPVTLIEDFDSLAVGTNMHDVDGWEGWYGDANAGARVTDAVAYSGTNSLEIVGNRDDLVSNWTRQTTGKWVLSVMQYCPSDKQTTGLVYFGILTEYDGAAGTKAWIGEFIANFATGKAYYNWDRAIQVDLVYDDWVELRLEVDLDAQEADFYYNNVFLATATRPAPSLVGVNIYPEPSIEAVYFDDFRFEPAE